MTAAGVGPDEVLGLDYVRDKSPQRGSHAALREAGRTAAGQRI
jgi:hypothetical protein